MIEPRSLPTSQFANSAAPDRESEVRAPGLVEGLGAAWMLAKREWIRFFRQRNRVVAAIVQPLLFWVLFGTGLRGSFSGAGELDFLQFFLPGTVALIVLFTAIFSTISLIEDRREGFMQSVLVAPVGRWPILLGKVLGGSAIAWIQGVAFLALVFVVGTAQVHLTVLPLLALLAVLAVGMCSLGMIVAWPMDSTQGFHAIMMLGLMPMWLLSGSFFPIPAASFDTGFGAWLLGMLMRVNPLSYAMLEMRRLLYPGVDVAAEFAPTPWLCWCVTIVGTVLAFLFAWRLVRGSHQVDVLA